MRMGTPQACIRTRYLKSLQVHRWSISSIHVTKKSPYRTWLHDVYHFSDFSKHWPTKTGSGAGFDSEGAMAIACLCRKWMGVNSKDIRWWMCAMVNASDVVRKGKLFLAVRGVQTWLGSGHVAIISMSVAGTFHVPNAAKSLFQPLTVIFHVIYRRWMPFFP